MSINQIGPFRLTQVAMDEFYRCYHQGGLKQTGLVSLGGWKELARQGLAEHHPEDEKPFRLSERGRLLGHLFYTNEPKNWQNLIKFFNWQDNPVLLRTLNEPTLTKQDRAAIAELAEFTWWLNQVAFAVKHEIASLRVCNDLTGLNLTVNPTQPDVLVFVAGARVINLNVN